VLPVRLALAAILIVVFLCAPVLAFGAEPSVIEPSDGASVWSYSDAYDATPKREGGYRLFDSAQLYASDGSIYDTAGGWVDQTAFVGKGPHGGYDSTTNKCKTCHAVHRAEGAYYLLRASSSDDACDYCHVGGSAHSSKVVYDSSTNGKYTENGHTIGAGSAIPDSTTRMRTSFTSIERDGIEGPTAGDLQVPIREYEEAEKKLYRVVGFGRHPAGHPSFGYGETAGGLDQANSPVYAAIGPTSLSCSSCHQTHNAAALIWRPQAFSEADPVDADGFLAAGYKLLRRFPGASAAVTEEYKFEGEPLGSTVLAKVPESRLTTGFNYSETVSLETTYAEGGDDWRQPDWVVSGGFAGGAMGSATVVNQFTLSVWCADCHNLNIGGTSQLVGTEELGFFTSHAERTHPVPSNAAFGGSTGGFQCYSCHRNDLDYGTGCNMCHYSAASYRARVESVGSDFPHSGSGDGYKLLGSYSWAPDDVDPTADYPLEVQPIGPENLDAVCIRCHNVDQGGHAPYGQGAGHEVPIAYASCVSCHGDDAATAHEGASLGCESCHSAAALTLDCATCHPTPHATVDHTVPASACTACHDDGDAVVIHDGAASCSYCHGSGVTPSFDCVSCHADKVEPHGYDASMHTATPGTGTVALFAGHEYLPDDHVTNYGVECGMCHSTDLGKLHGDECATCHPTPRESFETWSDGCSQGGCHPVYHADSLAIHEGIVASGNCEACHEMINFDMLPSPCGSCHALYDPNDTVAPVTTSDALSTYTGTARISFTMMDGQKVGIGTTFHTLDGGPVASGESVDVPAAGPHVLEFWSVDQNGNVETPHQTAAFDVIADTTPPVTVSNVKTAYEGPASIALSATDVSSLGVKSTYYSVNGGAMQTGTSVTIPEPVSGMSFFTVTFWSDDWSGNAEAPTTVGFTVSKDITPPVTTCSASEGATYIGSQTFTMAAADTGELGVAGSWFQVDAGEWTAYSSTTGVQVAAPTSGSESHAIRWYSRDVAGNTELMRSVTFSIQAPVAGGNPDMPVLVPEADNSFSWDAGEGPVPAVLNWSAVTAPDGDPIAYRVEVRSASPYSGLQNSGAVGTYTTTDTSYTIWCWGAFYYWRVTAYDSLHPVYTSAPTAWDVFTVSDGEYPYY